MPGLSRPALKEEYVSPEWKQWLASGCPPGIDNYEPLVDVIAVQGLASTYEWTWKKRLDNGTHVMWLRDLLPKDLPLARILTFEYDSKWLEDPSFVSLGDCGARLLQSIIWDRTHQTESHMCPKMARRPLILIGHSYGGLVIKQALISAVLALPTDSVYESYLSIATSVAGILFLGTPHAGSVFANYGNLMGNLWSSLGGSVNVDMLKPLRLENTIELLPRLHNDFQRIQNDEHLLDIHVYHFWETKGTKVMKLGRSKPVVEEYSACYGARAGCKFSMDSDHSGMNKYGSRDDSNYRVVRDRLLVIAREAQAIVNKRWEKYHYGSPVSGSEIRSIEDWLSPMEITSRHDRLQTVRMTKTCGWILDIKTIQRWLNPDALAEEDNDVGLTRNIWICGKAGSGKSVLSAFLYDETRRIVDGRESRSQPFDHCSGTSGSPACDADDQSALAALYFPLQESQPPILIVKSLIHQLLKARPADPNLRNITTEFKDLNRQLSFSKSIELLISLLSTFSLVFLIIDGLDESDESAELVKVLKAVSTVDATRTLIFSRQDEALQDDIEMQLSDSFLIVNVVGLNTDDINLYVTQGVSDLACTNPTLFSPELQGRVCARILAKAQGMFQWVNLVLDAILHHGKSEDDIMKTLEHYPGKLDGAYSKTFERLQQLPDFKRTRVLVALQWLTCTIRPLRLQELKMAIDLHEKKEAAALVSLRSDHGLLAGSGEEVEQFFSFLGPLVDIRSGRASHTHPEGQQDPESDSKTIEICHHSLKQWIRRQSSSIDKTVSRRHAFGFTPNEAHTQAALICLKLLNSKETLLNYFQVFYDAEMEQIPLLSYAGDFFGYHLRASGINSGKESTGDEGYDLLDMMSSSLKTNLQISLTTLSALSLAVSNIRQDELQHLPQIVAIRDLQNNLLSGTEALVQLLKVLSKVQKHLEMLVSRFKRDSHQMKRLGSDLYENSQISDLEDEYLTAELDSPTMMQVMHKLQQDYESQADLMEQIRIFQSTARGLRRVTLFISVNPIRDWVYRRIGNDGTSPIPALAHASAAIDTYLAAFMLPPSRSTQYDFRNQFSAAKNHQFYGPILSARYELASRGADHLGAGFYKQYILPLFQVRRWEWELLRIILAILETPQNILVSNPGQLILLRRWLSGTLKIGPTYDSTADVADSSRVLKELRPLARSYQLTRPGEIMVAVVKFIILTLWKVLALIVPYLEALVVRSILMIGSRYRLAVPLAKGLRQDWFHASLALIPYAIRLQRFPWLFSSVRYSPIRDLQDISQRPFSLDLPIIRPKFQLILIGAHEIIIGLITFLDSVCLTDPKLAPYFIPVPLYRKLQQRRSSPADEKRRVRQYNIIRHVTILFFSFFRIIFLERTLYVHLYLLHDLIKMAAFATHPTTYNALLIVLALYRIFLSTLAVLLGPGKFLGLVLGIAFIDNFGKRMRLDSLSPWGFIDRGLQIVVNFINLVLSICIFSPWRFAVSIFQKISPQASPSSISSSIVSPTTIKTILTTPSSIAILLSIFILTGFFLYSMSDPLNLRYARRSAEKTARITMKQLRIMGAGAGSEGAQTIGGDRRKDGKDGSAVNDIDPIATLGWRKETAMGMGTGMDGGSSGRLRI